MLAQLAPRLGPFAFVSLLLACGGGAGDTRRTASAESDATLLAPVAAQTDAGSTAGSSSRPSPSAERASVAKQQEFADLSSSLSEPDRYFFSDNLISNETSYLDVGGAMRREVKPGGVYVGVGPEQNFSYIALARPKTAFVVDIRRDNLLLQLVYRACFEQARSRSHFVALLIGRELDAGRDNATDDSLDKVLALAQEGDGSREAYERVSKLIELRIAAFGLNLSVADREKIAAMRDRFHRDGLGLRFALHENNGRRYPTLGENLRAQDAGKTTQSYLAAESDFRFVQQLQKEGRVIPVVGDFAGDHALVQLGRYLGSQGSTVSVFYVSNVEQYLLEPDKFAAWKRNVAALPTNNESVFIRAYLDQGRKHPRQREGHRTANVVAKVSSFLQQNQQRKTTGFFELCNEGLLEP